MTPERRSLVENLNAFIRQRGAWAVSWPMDKHLRFEAVPDTAEQLAHDLQRRGYAVRPIGCGERFVPMGCAHSPVPTAMFEIVLPSERPALVSRPDGTKN